MSVVNEMLRDLDRRQASDATAVYTQHLRTTGNGRRNMVLIIVATFLVAIAGTYAALKFFAPAPTPAEPVAQAKPIAKKKARPAPPPPPVQEAPAEPEAPPAAIEPPPPAPQDTKGAATPAAPEPAVQAPAVAPAPAIAPQPVVQPEPVVAAPKSKPIAPAPQRAAIAQDDSTKIDVRKAETPRTADSEFRRAAALIGQARAQEARSALQSALDLDPKHEGARQTLAVLLIEAREHAAAETLLTEGLRLNRNQSNFAIVLARLKLDRGDDAGALQVLQDYAAGAANNAEYRAFAAALMQRLGRHAEAVDEYRAVLKLAPQAGVWWVGLGISQEALGQSREAIDAYNRARATDALPGDVAQFVERKLQTLH